MEAQGVSTKAFETQSTKRVTDLSDVFETLVQSLLEAYGEDLSCGLKQVGMYMFLVLDRNMQQTNKEDIQHNVLKLQRQHSFSEKLNVCLLSHNFSFQTNLPVSYKTIQSHTNTFHIHGNKLR